MTRVLELSGTPVMWRVTDPGVLRTLAGLCRDQAATDDVTYPDRYAASRVVMAYRELLRRHHPDLQMRCRIVPTEGGYRWFARVERRAGQP